MAQWHTAYYHDHTDDSKERFRKLFEDSKTEFTDALYTYVNNINSYLMIEYNMTVEQLLSGTHIECCDVRDAQEDGVPFKVFADDALEQDRMMRAQRQMPMMSKLLRP